MFRRLFLTLAILGAAPLATRAAPLAQDLATLGAWHKGTRLGAVAQTPEGYLWLATNNGLIRFDGSRFFPFTKGPPPGLPTNDVRALAVGADGTLLIGMDDGGGIARIEPGSGTPQIIDTGNSLKSESIRSLLVAADGLFWIGTTRGLWRWDRGAVEKIAAPSSAPWPGTVTALAAQGLKDSRSDGVFVGTSGGLLLASPGTAARMIPGIGSVAALVSDGTGGAFVIDPEGLRAIDADGFARSMPPPPVDLGAIRSLALLPEGALLVGFARGLGRLRNGVWDFLSGGGSVDLLALDREGGVWAGNNGGSIRRLGSPHVRVIGPPVAGIAAFADGRVFTAFPRRVVRMAGGELRIWINDASPSQAGIRALSTSRDGTLWIGTLDGGLLRLAKDGVAIEPVPNPLSAGHSIQILFEDQKGALYLGHRNGTLTVKDARGFTPVALPTEPCATPPNVGRGPECAATITAFAPDPSGGVWMGTRGSGLFHITGETVRPVGQAEGVPFDRISTLLMDAEGSLWIGGEDKGLARRRPDPGDRGPQGQSRDTFERISDDAGLPSQNVLALIDDLDGNLWMASDVGLFRVRKQALQAVAEKRQAKVSGTLFDNQDGVPLLRAGRALPLSAGRASDGTLWFTSSRGAVALSPRDDRAQPPLHALVETVHLEGRPLLPQRNRSVELPAAAGAVQIAYTAPTFIAPHRLRFQYRLDGFDSDWIDAGDRRVALYARLPAGMYAFRVRAQRSDGEPAETTLALRVTSVYERWPFWLSLGFSIVAIGLVGHRVQVRMERGRFRVVLDERNRIARDLHDSLAQYLSGIGYQLERLSQQIPEGRARDILGETKAMVQKCRVEARQTIWNLRSQDSTPRLLSAVLGELIPQLRLSGSADVTLQVTGTERPLPDPVQAEVVRVVQEATANALVHAQAKQVVVSVVFAPSQVVIRVEDDGVGFDPDKALGGETQHFGLVGLRERAQHLRGTLRLDSAPGQGATIEVTIPT